MLLLEDIKSARAAIMGKLHRTPLLTSKALSERSHASVYLKAELLQKTGSFKPRGVLNKLAHLSVDEKRRGLIAVSAGNHAQALAYVAQLEKVRVTVVMPQNATLSKVEATRGYGAEVVLHGEMAQIFAKANELREAYGFVMVHPFDDFQIMAGQGTIGLEILEDLSDVDAVIVPIGGGGLIAGISAAIKLQKPSVKIFGVEPEGAAAMFRSLKEGKPIRLEKIETMADGLSAPFAGELTYPCVKRYVDEIILVTDEEMKSAMRLILERCKLLAEPAGAASVAALLSGRVRVSSGAKTVCLLSGGNVDLQRILEFWKAKS